MVIYAWMTLLTQTLSKRYYNPLNEDQNTEDTQNAKL